MDDDDNTGGELIPTEPLSVWASEIAPGDLVVFRLRHPAFLHAPQLPEMAGQIVAVLAGHELTYLIKVLTTGDLPWPDLFVRRGDILRAWVP